MDLVNLKFGPEALLLSLAGFIIVFAVLYLIAAFIKLNSMVLNKKKPENDTPLTAVETKTVKTDPVESSPAGSDDVDLVLIAAAIAAYLDVSPDSLIVKSIRNSDSAWAAYSRINNMTREL